MGLWGEGGQERSGSQGLLTSFYLQPRVWLQAPISRTEAAWARGCQVCLAFPLGHTAAGRAGRGGSQSSPSLLRSVGAQLVFTKRVGPQSQGPEPFALRGAGPWKATRKGWQSHCLLQSSEAGPQQGGFWEMRAPKPDGEVVSGG